MHDLPIPSPAPLLQHPLLLATVEDFLERAAWGLSIADIIEQLEIVLEEGLAVEGILRREKDFDDLSFAEVCAALGVAAAQSAESVLRQDPWGAWDGFDDANKPLEGDRGSSALTNVLLHDLMAAREARCRSCTALGTGCRTAAEMVVLAEPLLSGQRGSLTAIRISEVLPLIEAVKSTPHVDMRGATLDVAQKYLEFDELWDEWVR